MTNIQGTFSGHFVVSWAHNDESFLKHNTVLFYGGLYLDNLSILGWPFVEFVDCETRESSLEMKTLHGSHEGQQPFICNANMTRSKRMERKRNPSASDGTRNEKSSSAMCRDKPGRTFSRTNWRIWHIQYWRHIPSLPSFPSSLLGKFVWACNSILLIINQQHVAGHN